MENVKKGHAEISGEFVGLIRRKMNQRRHSTSDFGHKCWHDNSGNTVSNLLYKSKCNCNLNDYGNEIFPNLVKIPDSSTVLSRRKGDLNSCNQRKIFTEGIIDIPNIKNSAEMGQILNTVQKSLDHKSWQLRNLTLENTYIAANNQIMSDYGDRGQMCAPLSPYDAASFSEKEIVADRGPIQRSYCQNRLSLNRRRILGIKDLRRKSEGDVLPALDQRRNSIKDYEAQKAELERAQDMVKNLLKHQL